MYRCWSSDKASHRHPCETLPPGTCPSSNLFRYFDGKKRAEEAIVASFPSTGVFIKPTFIYGGESFGLTPPRVSDGYGSAIDTLLSSGVVRSIAGISPGLVKVCKSHGGIYMVFSRPEEASGFLLRQHLAPFLVCTLACSDVVSSEQECPLPVFRAVGAMVTLANIFRVVPCFCESPNSCHFRAPYP